MNVVQIVAPTSEPITLDEAKLAMRVLEDFDDTLINTMIADAREYAEDYTNRQFMPATFELYTDKFVQDMKMRKNPIKSIEKIEYMDENGNYQILGTDNYYLYGDNDIYRIHFEKIVPHKKHKEAIKITFVAGYDKVPNQIVAFIRALTGTTYEKRELYSEGIPINTFANPMMHNMINMYRIQPL